MPRNFNFLNSASFRLLVLSYLSGADLYHKIALIDKRTRDSLPDSGLLDQIKILTMNNLPARLKDLTYAFKLLNAIELLPNKDNLDAINFMSSLAYRICKFDLILDGLTLDEVNKIFIDRKQMKTNVRKITCKNNNLPTDNLL